jgi:peroxiredoxin
MPMHIFLLFAFLQGAPAGEPLRSGCSSDAQQIATVGPSDRVEVLPALAGEDHPCYKITVTQSGQTLTGYVLSDHLPAIQAFQRERGRASEAAAEAQARLALVQAQAGPKAGDKEPDTPKDPLVATQFEDFSGRDSKGKPVSLSALKGQVTLVNFWSPQSGKAEHQVVSVMGLYNQFRNKGLAAVGVSMDPNPNHITDALDDVSPNWPQVPDRTGLAAHYNVDPKAGKVFVLDANHRIVAAGPMGPDIEKAVRQLLAAP